MARILVSLFIIIFTAMSFFNRGELISEASQYEGLIGAVLLTLVLTIIIIGGIIVFVFTILLLSLFVVLLFSLKEFIKNRFL